jgi:hypothetical protein
MKKILILLIGLLIAYPLYYYVAHNNGLLYKIPYGLVAFASYFLFFSGLTSRFKDKSYYDSLGKFTLIGSIIMTIVTYETFDKLTFGSNEEQTVMLAKSKNIAIGKIVEIEHFDAYRIKRKDISEHWEVKYEFTDSTNQIFKGLYLTNILPSRQIGDTLMVKYVKGNPEINEQLKR